MFRLLGRAIYRVRYAVLVAAALFLTAGLVYGTGVFGSLQSGGFVDPSSESARADARLQQLQSGSADLILLFHSAGLSATDPAFAAAARATLDRVAAQPGVQQVTSFYGTGSTAFISRDGHSTYALVGLSGTDNAKQQRYDALKPLLTAPPLTLQAGGSVSANEAISAQVSKDLARAESLTFPVTAVLLLLIFGGVVAASLPLATGGLAILGAFMALRLLTLVTSVSIFSVNVVTALGLGLAIDYALFMVSRFREELPGRDVETALARTLATAGRTIAFSGVTVAFSLAALLLFPQMFLRSLGLGGIAAVLVAMLASLTVLPALLAVLGTRVNALSLRRLLPGGRERAARAEQHGFWYRVAQTVMRRPLIVAASVIIVLLVLGSPFLRARFALTDVRALPPDNEVRAVSARLSSDFAVDESSAVHIALQLPAPALSAAGISAIADYSARLQALPQVTRVESLATLAPGLSRAATVALLSRPATNPRLAAGIRSYANGSLAEVSIFSDQPASSIGAQQLVKAIRAVSPPAGATALTGGTTAQLVDQLQSLGSHVPLGLAWIVVAVFVLLFLAFGSLVVPAKALLLNVLSLTATFGALVWVFQEGHLQQLLRFQSIGSLDATQPAVIFAIAFGLSMDYEVFLLSRIKERFDETGDNTLAVSSGLQRTGGIITSAALLLTVVFAAFATSGLIFIKEVGIGMALAVIMDATIVRSLLVPATMRLMGRFNWWAPAPLRRLWLRAGLSEAATPERPVLGRPLAQSGD